MESTNTPVIKSTADAVHNLASEMRSMCIELHIDRTTRNRIFGSVNRLRAALATPAIQAVAPTELRAAMLDLIQDERFGNDSYCEVCKAHAPKDDAGHVIEKVKHYNGCTVGRAIAALAAVPAQQPTSGDCSCPSGNGSLSWPCPMHPPLAYYSFTRRERRHLEDALGWANDCKPQADLVALLRKLAAPAAPVAPDLASLTRWEFGFEALRQDKFGDYVLLADVERLLSHSAQAPVEPSKELTGRDIRYLLDKHAEAAIDVHEHGDTGGFCVALESAEQAIFAAISNPVEQVSEGKRDAEQWREMLAAVMAEMPQRFRRKDDRNAPGHGHSIPGIWDRDNGTMAGQECAWCKVWNAAVDRLATTPTKESI